MSHRKARPVYRHCRLYRRVPHQPHRSVLFWILRHSLSLFRQAASAQFKITFGQFKSHIHSVQNRFRQPVYNYHPPIIALFSSTCHLSSLFCVCTLQTAQLRNCCKTAAKLLRLHISLISCIFTVNHVFLTRYTAYCRCIGELLPDHSPGGCPDSAPDRGRTVPDNGHRL